LNTHTIAPGIYSVTVSSENKTLTKKVVIN